MHDSGDSVLSDFAFCHCLASLPQKYVLIHKQVLKIFFSQFCIFSSMFVPHLLTIVCALCKVAKSYFNSHGTTNQPATAALVVIAATTILM